MGKIKLCKMRHFSFSKIRGDKISASFIISILALLVSAATIYFSTFYKSDTMEAIMTGFTIDTGSLHMSFVIINKGTKQAVILDAYPGVKFIPAINGMEYYAFVDEPENRPKGLPMLIDPGQSKVFNVSFQIYYPEKGLDLPSEKERLSSSLYFNRQKKQYCLGGVPCFFDKEGVEYFEVWMAFKAINSNGQICSAHGSFIKVDPIINGPMYYYIGESIELLKN